MFAYIEASTLDSDSLVYLPIQVFINTNSDPYFIEGAPIIETFEVSSSSLSETFVFNIPEPMDDNGDSVVMTI